MENPLATYLHDHLAGAAHAIDLVRHLREQYAADSLGQFASGLLVDIEADRATLQGLADRVGGGSSGLKEMAAWLTEKMSWLKLNHGKAYGLGTFEALEFLQLGIHGKLALWRALAAISSTDARLQGMDFERLAARAESQHAQVEERRLQIAGMALNSASNPGLSSAQSN
jgi:hypothetical protein